MLSSMQEGKSQEGGGKQDEGERGELRLISLHAQVERAEGEREDTWE